MWLGDEWCWIDETDNVRVKLASINGQIMEKWQLMSRDDTHNEYAVIKADVCHASHKELLHALYMQCPCEQRWRVMGVWKWKQRSMVQIYSKNEEVTLWMDEPMNKWILTRIMLQMLSVLQYIMLYLLFEPSGHENKTAWVFPLVARRWDNLRGHMTLILASYWLSGRQGQGPCDLVVARASRGRHQTKEWSQVQILPSYWLCNHFQWCYITKTSQNVRKPVLG